MTSADQMRECRKAIDVYRRMLGLEMDQNQRARALMKLGHAFVKLAGQSHSEENLCSALNVYREALSLTSRSSHPRHYAELQNSLGLVHLTLAELLDRSMNLQLASEAFNEGLSVLPPLPEVQELRASLLVNLGDVSTSLAEVVGGHESCTLAVQAYLEALKAYGSEGHPPDCAVVQSRLGAAYRKLGEIEDKPANCLRAVEACREALNVHILEKFPVEHSMDQIALGNAHLTLSESIEEAENCLLAVKAYQAALAGPSLSPDTYSAVQNNLGIAYTTLARSGGPAEIAAGKRAVCACREALRFRSTGSLASALSQNNLGNALMALAHSRPSGSTGSLEEVEGRAGKGKAGGGDTYAADQKALVREAISAYRRALEVPLLRGQLTLYRAVLSNLGEALLVLAEEEELAETRKSCCKKAIQSLQEALEICPQGADLEERAQAEGKLCLAYLILAGVDNRDWCCSQALKAGEAALEFYRSRDCTEQSASLQRLMGVAYNLLADDVRGPERTEYYLQAAEACREALQVYTREASPEDYAELQAVLCSSLLGLCACSGDAARFGRDAVDVCREALKVYSQKDHPLDFGLAQRSLAHSLMALAEHLEDGRMELQGAIAACQEALQVYQPAAYPLERADVLKDQGYAWAHLAEKKDGSDCFREALRCYKRALKLYSDLLSGRQFHILDQDVLEDRAESCRRAIRTCKKALKRSGRSV